MKPSSLAMSVAASVALLCGCSDSAQTAAQEATAGKNVGSLTGYTVVGPPMHPGARGPVTVALSADASSRLASLVRNLPRGDGPRCIEPASLMYKIALPLNGGQSTSSVTGYRCGAAVMIVNAAGRSWHIDSSCRLITEVRRDLPASARGTLKMSVGCQ